MQDRVPVTYPNTRMGLAGLSVVEMTMDEFQEEAPTKPEVSESMAETLERLRTESSPSERPSVRMKAITKSPEIP